MDTEIYGTGSRGRQDGEIGTASQVPAPVDNSPLVRNAM